jgi:transposase
MGQVLHGSARTTEAVRRAIQLRQESVRALARRYGVSPTTIQKWRKRQTTADARMGPKQVRSTVLTSEEEAIIVAFRRHTLLPLDDCLYSLQPTIPHLTRSSLHRCLARHGISRLPEIEGDRPAKKRFANYPLGGSCPRAWPGVHIDIAEVQTEEGKLRLFVAISRQQTADPISQGDRASRPGRRPYEQVRRSLPSGRQSRTQAVQLVQSAGKMEAAQFLRALIEAVPYKIHTVLTDNSLPRT